ncbi:MAG: glycoside hydrolase family 16 protein [Pyrinomonadaceae bacterium]
MRFPYTLLTILTLLSLSSAMQAQSWRMVWSDEFNGADGSGFDTKRWTAQTGGDGWGNKELEYYTAESKNVYLNKSGSLAIKAIKETLSPDYKCWYGGCQYTSARLMTKKKFQTAYGRFEARIKIPYGQGVWPAFWLLGGNIDEAGWPSCGEIDVMENIGREPSLVHGTIHGPGYSGDKGIGSSYSLARNQLFAAGYHTFAVEWETDAIRWYVDGNLYETRTRADLPAGTKWVYDHPFFIILNLAIGGAWPGNPDATTTFPQTMLVDYVRVYQR